MRNLSKIVEFLVSFPTIAELVKVNNPNALIQIDALNYEHCESTEIGKVSIFCNIDPVNFITFDASTVILAKLKTW